MLTRNIEKNGPPRSHHGHYTKSKIGENLPRHHFKVNIHSRLPGETEEEFSFLLNWLEEAQLDRVGCFQYENVEGAKSKQLSNQVPNDIKQDRWERFMSKANEISCSKLERKVGTKVEVIVDQIDEDAATCRTKATHQKLTVIYILIEIFHI